MDVPILKSSFSSHLQHTINYLRYLNRQNPIFSLDGEVRAEDAVYTAVRSNAQCHWTHIFSLSREDYDRLALNRDYMVNLLNAKRSEIAQIYNITPRNLRLYASLHDKDHHPHLHMVFFSTDPREGFVRGNSTDKLNGLKTSSTKLKSLLVNEIFREETREIYIAKSNTRRQLNEQLRSLAREVTAAGYLIDRAIKEKITMLHDTLQDQKGKLTYGYLPPKVKELVQDVLKTMVFNDPVVSQLFESYKQLQYELTRRYVSDETILTDKMKKWEQEFFAPSKQGDASRHNQIIKAAVQLGEQSQSSKTIPGSYHHKNTTEAMQSILYAVSASLKNSIVQESADLRRSPAHTHSKALKRRHKNIVQQPHEDGYEPL